MKRSVLCPVCLSMIARILANQSLRHNLNHKIKSIQCKPSKCLLHIPKFWTDTTPFLKEEIMIRILQNCCKSFIQKDHEVPWEDLRKIWEITGYKIKIAIKKILVMWCNSTHVQKQSSIGVLIKSCSENLKQIYRRTPMSKCNFNKVALQLYWNYTSTLVVSCKFALYFQNNFL